MITIKLAAQMLETVFANAAESQVRVAVCVVDDAGDLIVFQRMDGAGRMSVALSQGKARTSALSRMPTEALTPLIQPGGPMYGLTNINGVQLICLGGGVPITRNGQLVGAVAVAGASSAIDAKLAHQAVAGIEWN